MTIATRTTAQLQRLHAIIGKLGIDKETKENMIYNLTGGRTSSAGDLMFLEAKLLIETLQKQVQSMTSTKASFTPKTKEELSNNKMRKAILSCCYTMHWTDNDGVDYERLDAFLLENGKVKKKLNDLTHEELVLVVTQFKQMEIKEYK